MFLRWTKIYQEQRAFFDSSQNDELLYPPPQAIFQHGYFLPVPLNVNRKIKNLKIEEIFWVTSKI